MKKHTSKFKYGWKPDLPDHRDKLYCLHKPTVQYPQSVDLRDQNPPVENQGALGSCTANSLAGALEFLELKDGKPFVDISRLFVYYNERVLEGDPDQDGGAQLRDGVKVLNQFGACSEEVWPYDVDVFTRKPSNEAYSDALSRKITSYHRLITLDDMLTCLAEGFPFVFGFTVYDKFESPEVAKTGIVNMPEDDEKCLGGHAVMAVGYNLTSRRFIIRNSWGSDWGQKGYFTISFDYLQTMAEDFWTIRK